MITVKKLSRAGFTENDWQPLDNGNRYRVWSLFVNEHCAIEVVENEENGKIVFEPELNCSDLVPIQTDSLTRLLTLRDLLK